MKKSLEILTYIAIILSVTLIIALMPTEKEGAIYDDTVRLHILANSDSKEDQNVKLVIRDKLLEKYSPILNKGGNTEEAIAIANELTPKIKNDVDMWLREAGYDYGCDAKVGVEWYDTRDYGDFSLPCGYYTSVQIHLGEADGKNWWCVMYPPLCLDIALSDAPADDAISYTDAETQLIESGGYNVKFKILELISESMAFSSQNG